MKHLVVTADFVTNTYRCFLGMMKIMLFLDQANFPNVLLWLRVSSPNADLSIS